MERRDSTGEGAATWTGPAAQGWVASQDLLDRVFLPFEELLGEAVTTRAATRVLDVGCGTGGTTVGMARRLGPDARCTGVDISEPMVAAARARAQRAGTNTDFILADAQTHAFQPAQFDAVVSRFGVMFFQDTLAAFTNLRRTARSGASLHLVVWRSPAENPFMTTAEQAAAPLLPDLPVRRADEPGQWGLAGEERVRRILCNSGWGDVQVRPLDIPCAMPAEALAGWVAELGPVGRVLQGADAALRAQVLAAVLPAFQRYVHGDEVRFNAACWMLEARA